MEKYSLKTQCPKCNCEHLTSEYIMTADTIKRVCTNCGFSFHQLPVDAKLQVKLSDKPS